MTTKCWTPKTTESCAPNRAEEDEMKFTKFTQFVTIKKLTCSRRVWVALFSGEVVGERLLVGRC